MNEKAAFISVFIICLFLVSLPVIAQNNKPIVLPIKQNGLWGLINTKGDIIHSPSYQSIGNLEFGRYVIAQKNNKKGIIDIKGHTIADPIFDDIQILDTNSFIATFIDNHKPINDKNSGNSTNNTVFNENGISKIHTKKYGIYALNGNKNLNKKYESIKKFNDTLYISKNNHKFGLISNAFEYLAPISDEIVLIDSFILYKDLNYWGCQLMNGDALLDNIWDSLKVVNRFLITTKDSLKALFCAKKKRFLTSTTYTHITAPYFSDFSVFLLENDNKKGLINAEGVIILEAVYDDIKLHTTGTGTSNTIHIFVSKDNKWGMSNMSGRMVSSIKYDELLLFEKNMLLTRVNKLYGVINSWGNELYPPQAKNIFVQDNSIKIYDNNALVIIEVDDFGREIDRFRYENVQMINVFERNEPITPLFSTNNRINDNNNLVGTINLQYGWFFSERNRRWGMKDQNDSILINPIFNNIRDIPETPYTLGAIIQTKTINRVPVEHTYLSLVNKHSNRIIAPVVYNYIETQYFGKENGCNYFTGIHKDGYYQIIKENFPRKHYAYIGECVNSYARVNDKGKIATSPYHRTTIMLFNNHINRLTEASFRRLLFWHIEVMGNSRWLELKGGKWGMINQEGEECIPLLYDYLSNHINERTIAKNSTHWGVLSTKHDTIIPFEYDHIELLENSNDSLFLLKRENALFGLMDDRGRFVTICKFNKIFDFNEGFAIAELNKKYGFIDKGGNPLTDFVYTKARGFSEGLAAVRGKRIWGYIDLQGNIKIPFQFTNCGNFKNGLAWAQIKAKYGYINRDGIWVVPPIYDRANDFENNFAAVRIKQKWGVINTENKQIIRHAYKYVYIYEKDGIIVCQKKRRKFVLFNLEGKKITTIKADQLGAFSEGIAFYRFNGAFGFINSLGEIISKPIYQSATEFHNGLAGACINRNCGYLNKNGEVVIPFHYTKITPFKDNVAIVSHERKLFVLNTRGDTLRTFNNFKSKGYENGFALLKSRTNNHIRYIKTDGSNIGRYKYDFYEPYAQNLYIGWSYAERKYDILDSNYNALRTFSAEYLLDRSLRVPILPKYINEGMSHYKLEYYYNVADIHGNLLFPTLFENIKYMGEGIFRVESLNRFGYIHKNGNWIWHLQE